MKAQASLDSLMMIGLGLVLAAAFFFVANVLLSDSIAASQAEEAVERIAQEVKHVYASGEGTVRFVDVTIPSGIEEINLDGNRVHMRVQLSSGSTDFYSNTPVKLVGSIDPDPGLERVEVRYLASGNVQVGELKLTASPKSLYFYLERSENTSDVVTVTNDADFTIGGIDASPEGLSDMVSIVDPAATLDPGDSDGIPVSVSVPSDKPIGTYTGHIRVVSSNGGEDDVLVVVSVQGGSPVSCTLSPASADLSPGQSRLFSSTCRNAASETVPCPLLTWSSDAGNVIPIASHSSSTLVATDAGGSYVNASAGFSCSSSVTVSGAGPLVIALSTSPASISAGDSITINATGDDSGRGDDNVSLCQVSVDGAAYQDMSASDGAFDEVIEDAYLSIGPKAVGRHNATVRCNGSAGLWGPVSTINFTVIPKPILFITNGATPSAAEQYWLDWLNAHSSGLGFSWTYSTAQDSNVASGATGISDFKIAMMAEYDTTIGQSTMLNNYQDSGGVIVVLGAALQEGPRSLGYTSSAGTSDGENEVYIVSNSHYITSGFPIGRLVVLSLTSSNYRNVDNLGGMILADGMRANSRQAGQPALDHADRLLTWGPTRPDSFVAEGDTITTRLIDYALNSSAIGG